MKLATFNVNGVNGRLPVLLRWLDETAPDIVCLQELKASQDKFPEGPIRDAGYGAIWHGQKSWNGVAILVRGADPVETRRGLPGDPDDTNSRYIEAAANGLGPREHRLDVAEVLALQRPFGDREPALLRRRLWRRRFWDLIYALAGEGVCERRDVAGRGLGFERLQHRAGIVALDQEDLAADGALLQFAGTPERDQPAAVDEGLFHAE